MSVLKALPRQVRWSRADGASRRRRDVPAAVRVADAITQPTHPADSYRQNLAVRVVRQEQPRLAGNVMRAHATGIRRIRTVTSSRYSH